MTEKKTDNAERAIDSVPNVGSTSMGPQHGIPMALNSRLQTILAYIIVALLVGTVISTVFGGIWVSVMLGSVILVAIIDAIVIHRSKAHKHTK